MATLDYDMDNFSGRWNRSPRYDIFVDGEVYYEDVCEESVDELVLRLERSAWTAGLEITVRER